MASATASSGKQRPRPNTNGGKTISLEAVKEYQVLISPYEARYGDFAGMLVNAVTKSGTNDVHGSAYGYLRNEQFARATSFVGSSPYRREQFGFLARRTNRAATECISSSPRSLSARRRRRGDLMSGKQSRIARAARLAGRRDALCLPASR